MNILLAEDQTKTADFIKNCLTEIGYTVDVAEDGVNAEKMAETGKYSLLLLDIMLPEQTGIETAKKLRSKGLSTPILMLTALSTTQDKVVGLDAGADDYLTKPFSLEELQARVRALLRRQNLNTTKPIELSFSNVKMDLVDRKVKRDNTEITLTTKEFSLLEYFLKNPDKPLSRKTIAEDVWNIHFDTETNFIDVYINMLRKKLDIPGSKKIIHTVVGVGYILKES